MQACLFLPSICTEIPCARRICRVGTEPTGASCIEAIHPWEPCSLLAPGQLHPTLHTQQVHSDCVWEEEPPWLSPPASLYFHKNREIQTQKALCENQFRWLRDSNANPKLTTAGNTAQSYSPTSLPFSLSHSGHSPLPHYRLQGQTLNSTVRGMPQKFIRPMDKKLRKEVCIAEISTPSCSGHMTKGAPVISV